MMVARSHAPLLRNVMSHRRFNPFLSRREMLRRCGTGLGALSLVPLLTDKKLFADSAPPNPLAPHGPHFAPKAKQVVHLFMNGGPSQVDTFDPKPQLDQFHGKPLPS